MNYIFAILFNTKLNRWHPILFYESPLPGGPGKDVPIRHKSRGHHTLGFDNREDSVVSAKEMGSNFEGCRYALEADIQWDGEGVPATVGYFLADKEGALVRAF